MKIYKIGSKLLLTCLQTKEVFIIILVDETDNALWSVNRGYAKKGVTVEVLEN